MPRRIGVGINALIVAVLTMGPVAVGATEVPPTVHYRPPVDAPIVDPFRPPAGPYGPGNRGLEYGTAPGTSVGAAAAGVVTFAGRVAGSRHVTVLHPDGLRTSYSFLARVDVVVGQRVRQGQVLGVTADRLHLGARVGDAYLDPATLFGDRSATVRLVPFDEPPGPGPGGERRAIAQLIGGAAKVAAATAHWLRHDGAQALRTAVHYLHQVGPGSAVAVAASTMEAWAAARAAAERPCTDADRRPPAPPPSRRIAILVAGLGSDSQRASIDDVPTSDLGYAATDVLRFSYRGGRVPDPTDGLAEVVATRYGPDDSQVDLRVSGRRLADLVEDVARQAPGATIDVLAHSQGGVVARLAIADLERRAGSTGLAPVGLVATLGSPHGGADLATAASAVVFTPGGAAKLQAVRRIGRIGADPSSTSVGQLAETSSLMRELAGTSWPEGVRGISIAAEGDVVVPVPRTELAGVPHVVVPLRGLQAHGDLPGSAAAARELALALAGAPPTCTTLATALRGQLTGVAYSWIQDALGAAAWLGTAS